MPTSNASSNSYAAHPVVYAVSILIAIFGTALAYAGTQLNSPVLTILAAFPILAPIAALVAQAKRQPG